MSQQKSMAGGMPFIGKSQIERIEVIKGPASVMHGSEAIGGVVNIITKKGGDKPFSGSVHTSYDTANNGFRQDFEVHGNIDGIEYAISYGNSKAGNTKTADGYLDENGENIRNSDSKRPSGTGSNSEEYSLYLGYKADKLHTGIRYDKHRMNYQVYSTPENSVPTRDNYMNIPDSTREKVSAFLELKDLTDNFKKLKLDIYRQVTKRDFDIFIDMFMDVNGPAPGGVFMDYLLNTRTYNEQVSDGASLQLDWEFGDHYIVGGLDIHNDDIDGTSKTRTRTGAVLAGQVAYEHYLYDAEMLTSALYLQDEWKISEKTTLTPGIRYTRVNSELYNTDDPHIAIKQSDSEDDNYSFSLGLVHHLNEDLTLRANYSQGYRHPNLVELYIGSPAHGVTPAKTGDPGLDPETSNSFEIGTRYNKDGLNLDLAVFYTEARNYITTNATQYTNVGGAETYGVELYCSYDIGDSGLTPYASATHLKRRLNYGSGNATETTEDSGVADLSGRLGLKYLVEVGDFRFLEFDMFSRYATDTDYEYSDGTLEEASSWETLNLEVSYVIETESEVIGLEIFGGIYNIFDREYTAFDELTAAEIHYVAGLTVEF